LERYTGEDRQAGGGYGAGNDTGKNLKTNYSLKKMEEQQMPEISRFEGIIVKMLFNDDTQHNKPHVHVYYGEYKASVGIDGELLAGFIPY